jgi:DNA-3-methyladenine glycosylase II
MLAVREHLSSVHGRRFALAGQQRAAFPTAAALLEVQEFPGLTPEKLRRLHGVARAAEQGRLDTDELRWLPPEVAAARARELEGIGPFYAELLTARALGHTDVLPTNEPRVRGRLAALQGRSEPVTIEEMAQLAERWRPWRTWACVHIRAVDPNVTSPPLVATSSVSLG